MQYWLIAYNCCETRGYKRNTLLVNITALKMTPDPLENFEIVINPATRYYVKLIKEINQNEGWTYTERDYDTWRSSYHKYWYFVAIEKDSDEPVASISLALDEHSKVSGELLYSIGLYYCNQKYRGTGLATKLWDMMFAVPEKDANITLYGAMQMSPKYASKYGFSLIPFKSMNTRFHCKDVQPVDLPKGIITKNVTEVPWSDVDSYENTVNPRPHPKFLKMWMVNEETYSRIAYDSSGKAVGILCIRVDIGGNLSCAPFYVDNQDAALALLSTTLSMIDLSKYGTVRLVHPESNKEAEMIASIISGGKQWTIDKSNSQFTKKMVEIPQMKIYSVAESASGFM